MKAAVLIIDDDLRYATRLSALLVRIGYQCLPPLRSLAEFKSLDSSLTYHLAVVDIELGASGNTDGIQIIETLRSHVPVIIHSEHNNQMTWNLIERDSHIDQLGKMCTPDTWLAKINSMIMAHFDNSYYQRLDLPVGVLKGQPLIIPTRFFLRTSKGGVTAVFLEDLYYLCTDTSVKGRVVWYTRLGTFYSTDHLDKLCLKHQDYNFFRVHKSYIINWGSNLKVNLSQREIVILEDIPDSTIPVGGKYLAEVRARMGR